MKRILLIAGLLTSLGLTVNAQQDAQYSQYMFNGIYINPAYAGYKEALNLHAFYRNQWTGIAGAPKSFSLAVDAIANDGNVGLALQVSSDKLGAQDNLSAYASYAYRIRLNADGSSRLAIGLSAGILQSGINGATLNPNDPETDMPAGLHRLTPDARAGIFFANDKYFAGFSVDNLVVQAFKNTGRFTWLPQTKLHYYLTAGMLLPINEDIQLKPSFLLKDDRGGPTSLDLNAFLLFKDIVWVGGSYRTGVKMYDKSYLQKNLMYRNAAVAAVEVFPLPNLRVGYAYDFSVGPLQSYSGGSHEISVGFTFNKQNIRMATPRVF
ncbi:PorP/SprF family type IX secretion system membrane protein [Chitinophaga ginsengisoli]|uniref:Type IX secretion system PorP/SprF family membrane protein n=1 Tax=Chitinophaga ginsengisoli TaxID=363837 RepID=A0A2P8GM98_9BACT|nr:type IX secretion system membrane protein PorP/SprF [Chitinophaga ginsengisoli]PSL35098.1 type IX secretion system PorP/SprF family membrane protein [Chitinophaga ginsengisoli]